MSILQGFINKGSDENLLKSLINQPDIDQEQLVKALDKANLVQKEIQYKLKNGHTAIRKQWVKIKDTKGGDKNGHTKNTDETRGSKGSGVPKNSSKETGGKSDSNRNGAGVPDGASKTSKNSNHVEGHRVLPANDGVKGTPHSNPKEFHEAISKIKTSNTHSACVDVHSLKEYEEMNCIIFDEGKAGIAVEPDGNIVSVFKRDDSTISKFMRHAIKSAVENGGNKLDCFDIGPKGLPVMYAKCGFEPVCKVPFNRKYAPEGWNYKRDGEPYIVFMKYTGVFKDPSEYDIPTFEEYDEAYQYRDEHMQEKSE